MPGDQDDSVPIGAAGADPTERPPELVERVPLGLVFRWAAAGTLGVLVVLLTAYGLYVVRDVLVLVMIALFVAVSLDPAIRWLIRHKVHRSYAVAIVVTAMLVLFGIFVWSVVPPLVEQGTTLFGNLPRYVRDLPDKSRTLRELSARYDLTAKLSDLATTLPAKVASSAIGFMQQFFGVLV